MAAQTLGQELKEKFTPSAIRRHLMSGISYLIPLISGAGLLQSIGIMLGGTGGNPTEPGIAMTIWQIGVWGMSLTMAMLAGGIGYSMADKTGFVPAIAVGFIATQNNSGFIGAVIGGFVCGAMACILKRVRLKWGLQPIMTLMITPMVVILVGGVVVYGLLGNVMASLLSWMVQTLSGTQGTGQYIHNTVLAILKVVDFGGVLNKMVGTYTLGLMDQGVYLPHTICNISLCASVMGLGITSLLRPKRFPTNMRSSSLATVFLGAMGLSEPGLPYLFNDPVRVIISSACGSIVVSTIMTFVFPYCVQTIFGGGLKAWPLLEYPGPYYLTMCIGAAVVGGVYSLLKREYVPNDADEDMSLENIMDAVK